VSPQSIFNYAAPSTDTESVEEILSRNTVRIERIVSRGHRSPSGFWYDQEESEWVIVLSGSARLLFEGDDTAVVLGPGSYVNIPAHVRHRVEWTDPDQETVWLAVFYRCDT
jgi:cupin 2 domain-containing protein